MPSKVIVKIHLYLATFFTPIILMFAISGGLYLFGIKGSVEQELVYQGDASEINMQADNLKQEVTKVLAKAGIEADFDYIKARGNSLYTRPTSTTYYRLAVKRHQLLITKETPDLVKVLVELHKGHGPSAFETLEKISAIALVLIMLSGLWLAFSRASTLRSSMLVTGAGFAVFFLLAL